MKPRTGHYVLRVGILFALYFSTAKLGLLLGAVGGFATAVWPPTGISLVALSLFGSRLWPGIALGAFLVNASAGAPLPAAFGMALGNSVEALLGAYLLRRVEFHPSLDRLRDVIGLVGLAAVLSTLVSAAIGATSGWLGGAISSADYLNAWWTWWVGDMMSDLVLAPLLFVWSARSSLRLPPHRVLEAGALLVFLVIFRLIAFAGRPTANTLSAPYMLFPLLVWAALRFGQPGAVTATFAVSAIAIWGTAHGLGPFAQETLDESLFMLQSFMSVIAVTILVLAADVSERRQAEDALRASEERLQVALEAGHMGAWEWNVLTRDVTWSKNIESIHGLRPGAFSGTFESYLSGIHPEDREFVRQSIARTIEQGEENDIEYRIVWPDGTIHWVEGRGKLFWNETGQAVRTSGVCMDITARRCAQELARERERQLQAILDGAPAVIYVKDMQGRYITVNRQHENLFHRTRDQVQGKTDHEIFPKTIADAFCANDQEVLRIGAPLESEEIAPHEDGLHTYISLKFPLFDAEGVPYALCGISTDITERKRAEERTREAMRTEVLLREIHHRVKNNLQVVSSMLSLQSGYIRDEQSLAIITESQHRIGAIALIHEKLYRSSNLERIDLSEYLGDLCTHLFHSYGADTRAVALKMNVENVALGLDTALPCGLIVNELVSNSLKHAFPDGRQGEIQIDMRSFDGRFVLTVSDNGIGFPKSLDFRQTESLGLQLVNWLTRQLEGSVELDDQWNGTRFRFEFSELDYKQRT
jgi:PAS domain S-box-containing protein